MRIVVGIVDVVFFAVFVVLLAALARRILAVPVGWTRSILFALIVIGVSAPLLVTVVTRAGLMVGDRVTANPGVVSLVGLLAVAWMFALGLAGLVVLEAVLPTGTVPGPAALISRWRQQRRRTRRYTTIVAIAVRHGLGGAFRAGARQNRLSGRGMTQTAVALRRALSDAGAAFVKLGQTLSTRRDLLHPTLVAELTKLQTQAEPAPWSEIEPAIVAALGRPIDTVFRSIEQVPLAAASVGQVHEARLLDGRDVVVKIQRPAARRQITADLDIMLRIARRLDRVTAWGRSIGIRRLAEGFAESLHEELNYTVELDNTRAIATAVQPGDRIVVPETFADLSSPTLLVMAKLDGVPIGNAADLLATFTTEERRTLAADILGSILRQIIVTGVFHADLHPGNLLVRPDRTVGLLDFGSVGRLDQPSRTALGLLLAAINRDDPIAATDSLIELLDRPDELDQRALERSVGELMVRFRAGTGGVDMFTTLFKLVLSHRFAVPTQIAATFRAMGALEGTLTLLSPGFDLVGAAQAQASDLMSAALRPTAIRQTLEGQLASVLPIIQRLPQRINKITQDLEQGKFAINVRPLADRRDREFITALAQQVMVTVLAAAATIGSIMLMTSDTGPMLTATLRLYSFLGYALLFVGFVLGLRVLVRVFFRHSPD
ncbi:MAG TPA: AarF/UbiB family protein [Pseudonocardiaceae bacterium]|jgi:ubiquinone biosynthesis protein|nr:AarF/UbiB family protein [Pseudonocardiaceae bacterium]